jgi:nucleoid DNA-binding protein
MVGMKKPDIAKRLATRSGCSEAEAADSLDRMVHHILSNVRKGKPAALPGLGRFLQDADGNLTFELEGKHRV